MVKKMAHFSPGRTILFSFFILILLGTGLLALPIAQVEPVTLTDVFFTATSATCVTGLFTIPLEQFTFFGHCVLLMLIQIGGLGLITMLLAFLSLFTNVGMTTQLMAGQVMEINAWKNIKQIVFFILMLTLCTEILGAACILPVFLKTLPFSSACFHAFFHAVSSFCNAGIALPGYTMVEYSSNTLMMLITSALTITGGLGFVTWYEIMRVNRSEEQPYHLSLYSKIVLYGTTILIGCTTILFWIIEHDNILEPLSTHNAFLTAFFNAATFRSTGFLTIPIGEFQLATLLFIMLLSFIGSSPASTGSGVKITTFAVFLATIKSAIAGKTSVEIKGRRLPIDQVYKAVAIISFSFGWILFTTFCLLITEQNWNFLDLLFEASSAFTTLGITSGVTTTLSFVGKLMIMASMIIGRIGSLTLVLALKSISNKDTREFRYPEERVMLG